MIAALINAARPKPTVCLGLPLRPFCMAHLLALHEINSAFLRNERPQLKDFMLAVLICSQDHQGTLSLWSDPDLEHDLKLWEKRLQGNILKQIKNRFAPFDCTADLLVFFGYLKDGLKQPVIKFDVDASAKETVAPHQLFTIVSLISHLNFSFEQAMNMPLPLARWLVAGYGEQEGRISIVDDIDLADDKKAADEFAAQVFAEERKRKEAVNGSA